MIHQPKAIFNPKKPTPVECSPDMDALRVAWRTLQTEEATCPPGCRPGIARKRMELLSTFPAWQMPKIIDMLNQPESEQVFV